MDKYDVIVIGAGPGGYVAAIRAAQNGAKTALVEKEFLGGTCLNWGCIPTKTLIAGAEVMDKIRHAAEFGISLSGTAAVDWPAMLRRKDKVVLGLRNGIAGLVQSNGIELIEGTAAFTSRHEIAVALAGGKSVKLTGRNIILATGSETVRPGFVPNAPTVSYSREALERPSLPGSLAILGGGVIGCEFACMYARLGVKVTLVEMLPEILPMVDPDVARAVRAEMAKLGIEVLAGTKVEKITADSKSVRLQIPERELVQENLLVCIGRRPYTAGLNLAAAGLATDARGLIPVDERCRTQAPGIYAIGDNCGVIQYAHRASAMGICAANNATGKADTHSDRLVPGCIFTLPEIGAVGLTETEAKARGLEVRVGKFPLAALGKAQAAGETAGFCKLIADAATDQILGVHIVGAHATDLIAEAATAMHLEITVAELGRVMHAHPTLAEAAMEAAHAVHGKCIHLPKPRRR